MKNITRPRRFLLYICDNPPREGLGCPVIIKRHLSRLANRQWRIGIAYLAPNRQGNPIPPQWAILALPELRFLKTAPISGAFRLLMFLWEHWIALRFVFHRPVAILSYTDASLSTVAARIAKRWKIPFNLIMFDHRELWEQRETDRRSLYLQTQTLVTTAARIWVVSERLMDEYKRHLVVPRPDVVRVLRPIPAAKQICLTHERSFSRCPVVIYAGSSQPSHADNYSMLARLLQKMNGTLILVEKPDNVTVKNIARKHHNVIHQPYFKTNQEAFDFIVKTASCILHTYSFKIGEQPWATASFPSKIIEYSHTGLPIFILVPPGTATHDWATENKWLAFADQLTDENISRVLDGVAIKGTWQAMAAQSVAISQSEFSAERIQKQFENELVLSNP